MPYNKKDHPFYEDFLVSFYVNLLVNIECHQSSSRDKKRRRLNDQTIRSDKQRASDAGSQAYLIITLVTSRARAHVRPEIVT